MQNHPRIRIVHSLALCMAVAILGACGTALGNPGNASVSPAPSAELRAVYARALADAAVYQERHVLPLLPAVPDAEGMVRVATLTADPYSTGPQTVPQEVWVSVVPEVRDSCLSWRGEDLAMRLRQLLGLRPGDSIAHFVEMRAPAAGMFRPTVDPAIHTRAPCSPDQARGPECGLHFPAGVDTAHVAWMAGQMLSAWKMPDGYPVDAGDEARLGYPWTRLGYTYNWHPGSPRYGASEYLVRAGTRVEVTAVIPYTVYCRE